MKKLLIILLPLSLQAQQVDTLIFKFSNGDIKYLISRGGAGVGTDSLWVNHNGGRSLLSSNDLPLSSASTAALGTKQGLLVSGTNIKTVNGNPLLGSGDIAISGSAAWGSVTGTLSNQTDLQNALNGKQATLVSATNIKTINGAPVLGSGDLVVSGSGVSRTFLPSDVVNANAVANTIADVTSLSFAVTANTTYSFRFYIIYSAAATTTGSRWSVNGPATTFINYTSEYTLTATSITNNQGLASYNVPAGVSASSLTTNNICIIEGVIRPSANGTVIARFASEIASSAITAVASGRSYVEYQIIN